jgi:polar amino acid transport system substrate-binding protein
MTFALSGCVEEEANKIIVGTSADFKPFEYVDDNGTIVGFDIELITIILENLNYTVEVKDIGWDPLIESLRVGNIDVIAAGMTITPEREEQIDFSLPYFEANQSVLVLTESNLTINSTTDLTNLTIGVQIGTTGQFWVEDNLGDNVTLKKYDLYIEAVLDLRNMNVDIVILDVPVAQAFADDEDLEVALEIETNEEYGFGIKKGNTELLNQINQELMNFMGSEEWKNLEYKYFKEQ